MSDSGLLWDSPVAMAYAEHYKEVEAARKVFQKGRLALMESLLKVVKERFGNKVVQTDEFFREDWYEFDLDLRCRFREARGVSESDRSAGVSVLIVPGSSGHEKGRLVFETRAFFRMEEGEYHRLRIDECPTTSKSQNSVFYKNDKEMKKGPHAAVKFEKIPVVWPDFTRDKVLDAIRRLPDAFDEADQWFAARVAGESPP